MNPDAYITYLERLHDDERNGRAALAALRRGLGQPPGAAPEASRYVQPALAADAPAYLEDAYYLVGSLFALHPQSVAVGNIGTHLRGIKRGDEDDAVERRFVALLSAHNDDLPDHLRQAISLLKSKDAPVNWQQLLHDVLAWGHPDSYIQKRWARSFWRAFSPQLHIILNRFIQKSSSTNNTQGN